MYWLIVDAPGNMSTERFLTIPDHRCTRRLPMLVNRGTLPSTFMTLQISFCSCSTLIDLRDSFQAWNRKSLLAKLWLPPDSSKLYTVKMSWKNSNRFSDTIEGLSKKDFMFCIITESCVLKTYGKFEGGRRVLNFTITLVLFSFSLSLWTKMMLPISLLRFYEWDALSHVELYIIGRMLWCLKN